MIFQFPDFDALQLALTSGVVPTDISLERAVGGVDDAGRPWLESDSKPTRTTLTALGRIGVTSLKSYPSPGVELVNWLQILPLQKEPASPAVGKETAVVFELPDPALLPTVVGEMMRLANDRQSFRWLLDDDRAGTVLLRVVGPPYYTLLRALERETAGSATPVRAYVEKAPRVWVEIGYTHPLVDRIAPAAGQQLLLRAPRNWQFLSDTPFRDIYEILDFKLPQGRLDLVAAELKKRLTVPLRLIDGDRHDAELWVLGSNAVDQLDALVRDARETLVQRLLFAVGQRNGETTIVLRARPSKQPPPQLVLDALPYARYLKLDNLFVPVGCKLHPVLRRDAIRKLLADDPARINWLRPDPDKPHTFVPESLPEDAFRPLQDWVDYVLDRDRQTLENWVQQFQFDFDPFVCPEEASDKPRPPGGSGQPRPGAMPEVTGRVPAPANVTTEPVKPRDAQAPAAARDKFSEIQLSPPSQIQIELAALEKQFLDVDGRLDDPRRQALWPELALRNGALKHLADAALCWVNLLWELPASDTTRQRELVSQWLRIEGILTALPLTATERDQLLRHASPAPNEVRTVAACVTWAALQKSAPEVVARQLPRFQQYLETHERSLGVRIVWLAAHALARLANNDALGLARVRDRLLNRLITDGLSSERDLPQFLRTAGRQDNDRLRLVCGNMKSMHDRAVAWLAMCKRNTVERTTFADNSAHFVDLLFAYGQARLGETVASRELLTAAEKAVAEIRPKDGPANDFAEVHQFLVEMYKYRIEQALQGRPHLGPLPLSLRERLDHALPKGKVGNTARYSVERMREQSRILEPQERFDPYRDYNKSGPLNDALARLPDLTDPTILKARIQELLATGAGKAPTIEEQVDVMLAALALAPRIGEAFTLDMLNRAALLFDSGPMASTNPQFLEHVARMMERALFLAAHYDRVEQVQQLIRDFLILFRKAQDPTNKTGNFSQVISLLTGECVRSLRKLGLRDEIGHLLDQMAAVVLNGRSVEALKATVAQKDWPARLQTLLHLAGGWMFFGWHEKAHDILNEARTLIFSEGITSAKDGMGIPAYATLVRTYVTVLSLAPAEDTLRRIDELFRRMPPFSDGSTATQYCAWKHLSIIESVVLAVVSEDFALGAAARRWLDEDHFLVLRRINRDHREMTAKPAAGAE